MSRRWMSCSTLVVVVLLAIPRALVALELEYTAQYKGMTIGGQTVRIEEVAGQPGRIRLSTQCRILARVLIFSYRYENQLTATFDGKTVLEYAFQENDNGKPSQLEVHSENGAFQVSRQVAGKTKPVRILKGPYDLHSWTLYCDPTLSFLPPGGAPASRRLFFLEDAAVVEETIASQGQETVEAAGRRFLTTHIIWQRGKCLSQSWHASEIRNAPVKYHYVEPGGETLFLLKSWKDK